MVSILTIIIIGAGYYFWRKPLSGLARATVVGLALVTCIILWLAPFASNAPVRPSDTDHQAPPQSRKAITGPVGETTAPAEQSASVNPSAQETTAKTTAGKSGNAPAPVSAPLETTDTATEQSPVLIQINDEQLDALIGDAIPVKLEGSTMVHKIVKKGTPQAANRNTPSDDDDSFPQVVEGPEGMVMIIPDEPLPSVSSRRQLTTGDDEIPAPGEVVALSYDMFNWSTGQMVESSQTALNGPLICVHPEMVDCGSDTATAARLKPQA